MSYLLTKIFFCLLLAGILGAIVGWLLKKLFADKKWETRYQDLENENYNVQSLLGEYKSKASTQDTAIQKLTSELSLKTRDNHTLAKSFTSLQASRNDLKHENETLNLKFTKSQESRSELEEKNNNLNHELEQALIENKRIEELESIISDLNNSHTNLQQKLSNAETGNEEIKTKLSELESVNDALEEKNTSLEQDNDQTHSELVIAKQNLELSQAEVDEWESRNQSLEAQLKSLNFDLDNSRKENEELQTLKDKSDALEKQSSDLNAQIQSLTTELDTSKKEAQKLYVFKTESAKTQNASLGEIKELKMKLESYQKAANDSAQELARMKTEADKNKSLNAKIQSLTSERNQLDQDLKKGKNNQVEIDKLKEQVQSLENEKSQLKNELTHTKQSSLDIANLESKLSRLESEKEAEKKKMLADLEIAQKLASSVKDLEQQLEDERKKVEGQQAEDHAELERYKKYLLKTETRWAAEVKELQHQIDSRETAKEIAQQKAIETNKALRTEFEAKIHSLNTEKDQLNKKYKEAQTKQSKASNQQTKAQADLLKLEEDHNAAEKRHKQALLDAESKSKSLQAQVLKLTNERDLLDKNYQKASAEQNLTGDKTSQLQAEVLQLKEAMKRAVTDTNTALTQEREKQSTISNENKELKTQISRLEAELSSASMKTPDNRPRPTYNKVNLLSKEKQDSTKNKIPAAKTQASPKVKTQSESKAQVKPKQQTTSNKAQKKKATDKPGVAQVPKPIPARSVMKKTRYPIEAIEGIGVVYGKRLRNINVNFVDTLLNKGKDPAGRKSLADRTDINKDLILTWVNHADLFRIDGVEGDYAELLEASGVDTVKALRNRNATNLTEKMVSVNKEKRLAPQAPEEKEVAEWIAHAARLKPMLTYGGSTGTTRKVAKNEIKKQQDVKPDDLTKIKGIGKVNEKILHAQGITTFAQIANFSKQDEEKYGEKLNSFHERITQEEWVKQAKLLHKNKYG